MCLSNRMFMHFFLANPFSFVLINGYKKLFAMIINEKSMPPLYMQNGIEIEYMNEKGFAILNAVHIRLCVKQQDIIILHSDLKSVFIKDIAVKLVDSFPFLLKISTTKSEQFVISFKTDYIREIFKIFLLNVIKSKIQDSQNTDKNEIRQGNKYLNLLAEMHELPKVENTKSSLVEYLVSNSVLLLIFYEMNCTLSQFYNYLKQSYFYDIKNTKNVIDRFLNEKLRNHAVSKDTYATRLNNFSFLSMNDRKENASEEKVFTEKVYNFTPIYNQKEAKEEKQKNNFVMLQKMNLTFDFNPEEQEIIEKKDYDKKKLKELLELCRLSYTTKPANETFIDKITSETLAYKEMLKDPLLASFNPVNYISKDPS